MCVSVAGRLIVGSKVGAAFDSGEWKKSSFGRENLFPKLLFDHNLIGMSRINLAEMLGEPQVHDLSQELVPIPVHKLLRYVLRAGRCMNGSSRVEFGLDANDKVWGLRMVGFQWDGEWYTDNVVFADASRAAMPGNVFPKNMNGVAK